MGRKLAQASDGKERFQGLCTTTPPPQAGMGGHQGPPGHSHLAEADPGHVTGSATK